MPIYEYLCSACGHAHEALQKMSDAALTDCPGCGKSELKKQISSPSFRLSGSGWYETDFKSGNKRNLTEKAGEKTTAKPTETSAAKPAEKKASAPSCGSGSCSAC